MKLNADKLNALAALYGDYPQFEKFEIKEVLKLISQYCRDRFNREWENPYLDLTSFPDWALSPRLGGSVQWHKYSDSKPKQCGRLIEVYNPNIDHVDLVVMKKVDEDEFDFYYASTGRLYDGDLIWWKYFQRPNVWPTNA